MSKRAQVVVIGAGVIGLAVALQVRRTALADVLVVDRNPGPGMGSTSRANGGVRAQFSTPINIEFSRFTIEGLASLDRQSSGQVGFRAIGCRALAAGAAALLHDLEDGDGFALALEQSRLSCAKHEAICDELRRQRPDQDFSSRGGLLQPRRDVDRVSDGGQLASISDDGRHHITAVDADREAQLALLVAHGDGRRHRAVGVVAVRGRNAEQRHDAVAHVLVDGAAVVDDDLRHPPQRLVDGGRHGLGITLLGQRGEADHVCEQHCGKAALATRRVLDRVIDGEQARSAVAAEALPGRIVKPTGWAAACKRMAAGSAEPESGCVFVAAVRADSHAQVIVAYASTPSSPLNPATNHFTNKLTIG